MLPVFADSEVHDPRVIEENGNRVGRDSIEKYMVIATSPEDVISAVDRQVKLGFDHIGLAISGDLAAFLDAAKQTILPYLREEYKDRKFNGEYRGQYDWENLKQLLDAKGMDKIRFS